MAIEEVFAERLRGAVIEDVTVTGRWLDDPAIGQLDELALVFADGKRLTVTSGAMYGQESELHVELTKS